jgi:hypothetical protein
MTFIVDTYATNVQKIEFDVTTAEGASRVTIVTGTVAITQSKVDATPSWPTTAEQTITYKLFIDPTLAPGKFRKATAIVAASFVNSVMNRSPGLWGWSVQNAQATFDDKAGQVQLLVDVWVSTSGRSNITQIGSCNFQVTTLAVV